MNPLLPADAQITSQDLLLIIGDQTVTITALRQQIQNLQAGAVAQATQLENVLKNKAVECDQAVADAKGKEDIIAGLRQRLELVAPTGREAECGKDPRF